MAQSDQNVWTDVIHSSNERNCLTVWLNSVRQFLEPTFFRKYSLTTYIFSYTRTKYDSIFYVASKGQPTQILSLPIFSEMPALMKRITSFYIISFDFRQRVMQLELFFSIDDINKLHTSSVSLTLLLSISFVFVSLSNLSIEKSIQWIFCR